MRDSTTRSPAMLPDDIRAARGNAFLRRWLFVMAGLVFAMVVVGGATRLTGSGLSITEWRPIMGAIPPLTAQEWAEAFAKYQAIPQYELLNKGMSFGEFQTIFWWEWSHRQLGRLIGLVFAAGFVTSLWLGALRGRRALGVLGIGALGGVQAMIGWIMVASGLKEGMVAVAPIKLMLHLTMAAVIFTLLVMVATRFTPKADEGAPGGIKRGAVILLLLTLLQIALGALVAGSKAGMTWNTWPLIDGHFIPPAEMLFSVVPWIENFVDNAALVQFNHRMSAYALLIFAMWHWWQVKRVMPGTGASRRATTTAVLIVVQAGIGIATLLALVPLWLALLHQAFAFVVLGMAAAHVGALYRARPVADQR